MYFIDITKNEDLDSRFWITINLSPATFNLFLPLLFIDTNFKSGNIIHSDNFLMLLNLFHINFQ